MIRQTETNNSKLRAAGYSRTSGEGQRDNTSIPRQKEEIQKFITANGWDFVRHYTDESLSGARIEGRDDFKRMMKDAANGQFDIIIIYDISRFARDGGDIIRESDFLKKNFGIHVIDTTKSFDTRKPRNALLNFIFAGVAEDERLRIMERTIGGRIEKAKQGLPWTGKLPAGRGFRETGKNSGEWFITEEGKKLKELLTRYVNGEALAPLAKEYGVCTQTITRNVRESNLAGTYYAKFNSPDIGKNETVAVPQIPEVITPELEQRVKDYMAHNQRWNKNNKQKYVLASFVNCLHCGKPLKGQTVEGVVYYRHYAKDKSGCSYRGIRGDLLERHVLDYLYNFFLDEPAYNKAVNAALPSDDDREVLQKDIEHVDRQLAKANNSISNLVDAIADGADVNLLLDKQNELKTTIQTLESRRDELIETLVSMPEPEQVKKHAALLRIFLMEKHRNNKDWQTISYDDVHRFLHFLFSDNPRKTGYGIFVGKINGNWNITFKGCAEFHHDVINGRAISHLLQKQAETLNYSIKQGFAEAVREADMAYERACKELEKDCEQARKELGRSVEAIKPCNHKLKPNKVNLLSIKLSRISGEWSGKIRL